MLLNINLLIYTNFDKKIKNSNIEIRNYYNHKKIYLILFLHLLILYFI